MRKTYLTAKNYLIRELNCIDANVILESYLVLPDQSEAQASLNKLFQCLLRSAQNANMKASVIGGSIGGIAKLGPALFNFDPKKVDQDFANNPEDLLAHIINEINPNGKVRTTTQSIWPKYCKTILSAAIFFKQFKNGNDFYSWAEYLYSDKRSMSALPMILAAEIEGIGYPLACDFLKELGFLNYGKPDVHLIQILIGIGLSQKGASSYKIQKVIAQIAEAATVSSYAVDKIFWIIGSGKFYNHLHIGKNGHIGSKKTQFIDEFNKLNYSFVRD